MWVAGNAAESGQTRASCHQHQFLWYLQQGWQIFWLGSPLFEVFPRCAVPLAGLDLQSQSRRKGQFDWRLHAFCFSTERFLDRPLHRIDFCLRFHWLPEFNIGIETVKRVLTGVVAASGLLHFYYDGFIWKVREKSTRQSLGLSGGAAEVALGRFSSGLVFAWWKWAVAFVVPSNGHVAWARSAALRASGAQDLGRPQFASERAAHFQLRCDPPKNLGISMKRRKEYATALHLDPDYVKVNINLGQLYMETNRSSTKLKSITTRRCGWSRAPARSALVMLICWNAWAALMKLGPDT